MADLIVVAYRDMHKAEEVLSQMKRLQGEYLVDLEDAAYVTRDKDGKVKLYQAVNIPLLGAVSGIAWGGLIGLLFLNPLLGAAIGAGSGALAGAITDYGINDDFMRTLGKELEPGGSAIFILARRFTPDKFIEELSKYGGTLLRSSLTHDAEEKLQQALSNQHQPSDQSAAIPAAPGAAAAPGAGQSPGMAH